MFKTDILFTGFYGHKNTGDDAFVEVASWGSQNYWNKKNNRFLAISKNLPDTIVDSKGYPFTMPKTYGLQLTQLIKETNYLISAGGSTIHSKMLEQNPKMIAVKEKKRNKKLKIGGIGVSIGPFNSIKDEEAIKEYLKSIDFLAVRDQTSYDYANSLELPYKPIRAFDLAALLPGIYDYSKEVKDSQNIKVIGVSVCPVESVHSGMDVVEEIKRNERLVDLLKQLDKKEEVHFRFYVINGNLNFGDLKLTQETILKVNPKSFELIGYQKNTKLVWNSIADCDFVVSTRLHASIFACFANTPFMLNEYHRKCSDFLMDIGYNDRFRLYNSEYDVAEKANQILSVLAEPKEYSFPLYVDVMKELAQDNFTKILL
ncbi:polysaccharide pyruvyl transferase family protein [Myroides sp. ZB35]|uniref:polysaccharide pyruvyl transferase family protein n=1 Tax=Myroides sp. ZB35 TaxID=1458492 RepID=UPI0008F4B3AE|nr:polysaccharide pyruvyl transferase family protein [Myroides sp. ZB35]APA93624.1 polysaccharide pyruvyl transferase [Myroides sp. ZB35]